MKNLFVFNKFLKAHEFNLLVPVTLKAMPHLMTDRVEVGYLRQNNRALVVQRTSIPERTRLH